MQCVNNVTGFKRLESMTDILPSSELISQFSGASVMPMVNAFHFVNGDFLSSCMPSPHHSFAITPHIPATLRLRGTHT
jgi:hypothetical protein